jgi:hypothetical protein
MVAVTYGVAGTAVPAVEAKAPTTKKSFFSRVYDAIVASQMRRAEREIAMHRHLLAPNLESHDDRLAAYSKDELPFGRR